MNRFTKKALAGLGTIMLVAAFAACSNPVSSSQTLSDATRFGARSIAGFETSILKSADGYAVFGGGAGVTNQGTLTSIKGDMGTTGASTMITGFHSATFSYSETPLNAGEVNGLVITNAPQGSVADFEIAKAVAADALSAYNFLASIPDGMDPGAGQLGGLTLIPGVYKSAAGPFLITGSDLTLDAQGNPDALWVFQAASSLTVGNPIASQSVILINGAQAKNVYWYVGSAATINGAGGGTMVGTIIASAGMTFSTAGNMNVTTLNGKALALFASITMVNTVINSDGVSIVEAEPVVVPVVASITVTGSTASAVVPVVAGGGFINVRNDGGLVTVTETGTGTIAIDNDGGLITATNTGNGIMIINSNATGVVTVTNTGNGNVTVNATGSEAITITHTGDEDFVYPILP